MGIFDALTTSVAGLQAQSFALQNISGNIANSQTTGYKETDTSFEDMVSAATQNQTTADGVIANSVATNTVAGTLQTSTVSTNMAINGDGWFVVADPTGEVDNQPTFSGVSDYTRAGDFQLNSNGNLVNGAGYYLQGIPIDAATGNPDVKALVYIAAYAPEEGETIAGIEQLAPGGMIGPETLVVQNYPLSGGGEAPEAYIRPALFHQIFDADLPLAESNELAGGRPDLLHEAQCSFSLPNS